MYLYETHLHTSPVSQCAAVGARATVEAYKSAGYAGIFLTNHFIDGNINVDVRQLPYEERIEFYFSGIDEAMAIGEEIGLRVFPGIEMTYGGTDFLVYGIDKEWCLAHKDMDKMKKSDLLRLLMAEGALVIQAHPFREAAYIDHIRLFPRCVEGVEVFNANRNEFENGMADKYAESYSLLRFAGTDNHQGGGQALFGGMATEEIIESVEHFIRLVRRGEAKPFRRVGDSVTLI